MPLDARRRSAWIALVMPASENLHNSGYSGIPRYEKPASILRYLPPCEIAPCS